MDHSGLLTICIYSHVCWTRSTTAKTCDTLPPRKLSHHTSLSHSHQPCISKCENIKHQFTNYETQTPATAEHLPHPQWQTLSEAGSITQSPVTTAPPQVSTGKGRKKKDLGMERGRRIRHGEEVCGGRRFSVDGDIRQSDLPFCSFLFCPSWHFTHSPTVISCLAKVIRYGTWFLYSFLFPDISYLLSLFVPIKASCRSVT